MNQGAHVVAENTDIQTKDGHADGFFYRPAGAGHWPGVLFLTDIGGIRPAQEATARRIAAEGYVVLVPNVFYRTRQPPMFDFPAKWGDDRTMKRFAELSGPMTPDAMERDVVAYVHALGAHHSVDGERVAVVGYCFGGAIAVRTAAMVPDRVAAAASYHGGRLCTDAGTSPHLLLPQITARLYFGHAVNDQSMPPEAIEKLERALEAWGGVFESEVYDGAQHGWTVSDNPAYNAPQAERAFATLAALLAETLT